MINNNLPTEDLKKYGIINEDNSVHSKISETDFKKFTQEGHLLIVQDEDKKVSFKLTDNKLDIKHYVLDNSIEDILEKAKENPIQYAIEKQVDNDTGVQQDQSLKVFIYNERNDSVDELDWRKHSKEITDFVLEKKDIEESKKYKTQLELMKSFLLDKMDKFPQVAKYIAEDINIVDKNINRINDATPNEEQAQEQKNTRVQLNVNDPDLYQEANEQIEEEWEEEQEKKRGFRR